MSIIADRGLFVRLLVQSGRFDAPGAESFADAVDAATREPATKADLNDLRHDFEALRKDVRLEMSALRSDFQLLTQRVDAQMDKMLIRLGGLGLAVAGLLFAALRLT